MFRVHTLHPKIPLYINDIDTRIYTIWKTVSSVDTNSLVSKKLQRVSGKVLSAETFNKAVRIVNNKKTSQVDFVTNYIRLSKVCFNSMMYKNKTGTLGPRPTDRQFIFDKENFEAIPDMPLKVYSKGYSEFLSLFDLNNRDFIFFDPPYHTPNAKYMYIDGFDTDDFTQFRDVCDSLTDANVRWAVTLDNSKFVQNLFKGYQKVNVIRKTGISESKIGKEVIYWNFDE